MQTRIMAAPADDAEVLLLASIGPLLRWFLFLVLELQNRQSQPHNPSSLVSWTQYAQNLAEILALGCVTVVHGRKQSGLVTIHGQSENTNLLLWHASTIVNDCVEQIAIDAGQRRCAATGNECSNMHAKTA